MVTDTNFHAGGGASMCICGRADGKCPEYPWILSEHRYSLLGAVVCVCCAALAAGLTVVSSGVDGSAHMFTPVATTSNRPFQR